MTELPAATYVLTLTCQEPADVSPQPVIADGRDDRRRHAESGQSRAHVAGEPADAAAERLDLFKRPLGLEWVEVEADTTDNVDPPLRLAGAHRRSG